MDRRPHEAIDLAYHHGVVQVDGGYEFGGGDSVGVCKSVLTGTIYTDIATNIFLLFTLTMFPRGDVLQDNAAQHCTLEAQK